MVMFLCWVSNMFLIDTFLGSNELNFSGLGLSDKDKSELKREVNIIFHSAASIKFDDELSKAVTMNVRGTKELMDLAKGMENLASFVHVSTCYSHCHLHNEVIQEKIYPPESFSVKEVLDMCQSMF